MMMILLLFGFITLGLAEGTVDLNCSIEGPTYWCKNQQTAIACHAERYCKDYVWEKEKEKTVTMDTCTMCQQVIGTLHMLLMNNMTQEQVLDSMKMACNFIPSAIWRELCVDQLEQHSGELIKFALDQTRDPRYLCKLIDMCPGGVGATPVQNFEATKVLIEGKINEDRCGSCKSYMNDLHSITSKATTKEELVLAFKTFCKLAPQSLSGICSSLMNNMTPNVIMSIFHYTSDPYNFCVKFGFCLQRPAPLGAVEFNTPEYIKFIPEDKDMCYYCTENVKKAHNYLADDTHTQMIIYFASTGCNFLQSPLKESCTTFLQTKGPGLIMVAAAFSTDAKWICQMAKMCPKAAESNFVELESLVAAAAPNGEICSLCQQIIGTIHMMISRNESQAMIISQAKAVCKNFPYTEETLCDEVIDLYAPMIIKKLEDNTKDPRILCHMIHLCPKSAKLEKLTSASSNDYCSTCKETVGFAHTFLEGHKAEVEKVVDMACSHLPAEVQGLCRVYEPEIYDILMKHTAKPGELCTLFHLCQSDKKEKADDKKDVGKIVDFCEKCQWFMHEMYTSLDNKTVEKMMKQTMMFTCNVVTPEMQSKCKFFLDKYFDEFYNIMVSELAVPKALCQVMHMCASSSSNALVLPHSNGEVCDYCIKGATIIESLVKSNKTKKFIIANAYHMCAVMPSRLVSEMCVAMVYKYGEKIFSFLKEHIESPKQVCVDLHLCSASYTPAVELSNSLSNGVECTMCEYGAEVGAVFLNSSEGQEKIKEVLFMICERVPPQFGCHALIEAYFEKIVGFLAEKLGDPEAFCTDVGLCEGTSSALKVKGVIGCEVCEMLMEQLEAKLEGKTTKAQIKNALMHLCNDLPVYSAQCENLVNQYADTIVDLLVGKVKPEQVCTALGFCGSAKIIKGKQNPTKSVVIPAKAVKVKGEFTCEICTIFINKLDSMLGTNRTEESVKHALEKMCSHLPFYSDNCKSFVDMYSETIVKLIIEDLKDSHEVCVRLHLCDEAKGKAIPMINLNKPVVPMIELTNSQPIIQQVNANFANQLGLIDNLNNPEKELPICTLCMFMSGKLAALSSKISGKMTIKKTLSKVCSNTKMSVEKREDCERMLDEHADMIIKLAQSSNLHMLCKKIGYCKWGYTKAMSAPLAMRRPGGTPFCLICEYIIGILDKGIAGHSSKAKIIAAVHGLCNHLPNEVFVTECNALIAEYGNELIQLLVDDFLVPVDVCQHFGVC